MILGLVAALEGAAGGGRGGRGGGWLWSNEKWQPHEALRLGDVAGGRGIACL